MGSNGALFLGYTIGVLGIIGGAKMATVLLVMGLPLLDVVWQIVRRVSKGSNPTQGDRGHVHFRLLDMGFSQRQIVVGYYVVLCVVRGDCPGDGQPLVQADRAGGDGLGGGDRVRDPEPSHAAQRRLTATHRRWGYIPLRCRRLLRPRRHPAKAAERGGSAGSGRRLLRPARKTAVWQSCHQGPWDVKSVPC